MEAYGLATNAPEFFTVGESPGKDEVTKIGRKPSCMGRGMALAIAAAAVAAFAGSATPAAAEGLARPNGSQLRCEVVSAEVPSLKKPGDLAIGACAVDSLVLLDAFQWGTD